MIGPKTAFSIYLLRESVPQEDVDALFDGGVPLKEPLQGQFVPFPTQSKSPNWFNAITTYLESMPSQKVESQVAGGLVLIRRGQRQLAICFGHAWQYLEEDWLEPDFGRRVALNTVDPSEVVELNSEQVFAKWHLAKERAPRASSIREFGVEFDRDLVYAIEGKPDDPAFGEMIRGATSLRISIPILALPNALDRALVHFESDFFRKRWPEIDYVSTVDDASIREQLDHKLDSALQSASERGRMVLYAPSVRKAEALTPASYIFGRRTENAALAPILLIGSWESHLARAKMLPSLDSARRTPVHMLDDERALLGSRNIYDCLGFETSFNGKQYILSSGTWFCVSHKLIDSVNADVAQIPSRGHKLLAWDGAMNERNYNTKCCAQDAALLHMDRKLVHFGGGQSKFEFCDFLDAAKRVLYFVKIPSQSAAMSHFTEQVRRTVELAFGPDPAFRAKLKARLEKLHPNAPRAWLNDRLRPGDWELCLVSLGQKVGDLPFFARCGLNRLVKSFPAHRFSFVTV